MFYAVSKTEKMLQGQNVLAAFLSESSTMITESFSRRCELSQQRFLVMGYNP